jgi:2-iminobutanoate/2-iminopropanoate deaminase
MQRAIQTSNAPQAIGPYSQAVVIDRFVFASGQIPINPATGEIAGSDIESQTRQVLQNLKAVLEASGANLAKVVKTTVFIRNMEDFPKVNSIYGEFFSQPYPARSTIEVSRLPRDVLIEIEAVAWL